MYRYVHPNITVNEAHFMKKIFLLIILLSVLSSACIGQQEAETRTITDMSGREVRVPEKINSVYATSPPATMLIYMLAPEKLAGWNFLPEEAQTYLSPQYRGLPVVGGWYGTQNGNYETIITLNPDIIIEGYTTDGEDSINIRQEKFGNIPVVGLEATTDVNAYKQPIRFTGELLGEEEKAQQLITFYEQVLENVTSTPITEKVHVYYAQGPEGLLTDPAGSPHSQLIEICGGINVAQCPITPGYGRTQVSMEQVLLWNPEIIITTDEGFFEKVYTDPLWHNITAVKQQRVYLSPTAPFCFFDRPPGVNRIIGIPWTAQILYPEKYNKTHTEELIEDFYIQFYHQERDFNL